MHTHLVIDGQLLPWAEGKGHISSDAWMRGMNVFEGLRAYWNARLACHSIVEFESHLKRLNRGLQLFKLPASLKDTEVLGPLWDLIATFPVNSDVYLRLSVFVERGGYSSIPEEISMRWCVVGRQEVSRRGTTLAATAIVSRWRKPSANCFPLGVKAGGCYLYGRMARTEAQEAHADEAIQLNELGDVCEAPGANIVVLKERILHTPRPEDGPLDGITLRCIERLCKVLPGLLFTRSLVTPADLYSADEIFLCGTLSEIVAITRIGNITIGNGEPGPITKRLSALYYEQIMINQMTCNQSSGPRT